jgi:MOSC domain-containing protein YiiM
MASPFPSSGRLTAVCLGPGGIPKQAVTGARVTASGLDGDGHRYHLHGGEHRALCLLSVEELAHLDRDGVAGLEPGAFGENLLVAGLDFRRLRPGDRLAFRDPGSGARPVVCELTDVRSPCKTLKAVDRRLPDLMAGRSGFVARVIEFGELRPGMRVEAL